ncbi:Gfo/Idh/MocA family protein [Micromonospora zamorensis]|uniref:Gfo/Idh/MocA family protein n=1 Tax=Micromonospora zamorensis TaxID=709883 RepID=UPI003D98D171
MRGAVVGFGTIAMGHLHGYGGVPELSVVAVVDPSPQRRDHAVRAFGLRAYATFEEMYAEESPDFVDICAPPHTHAEYLSLAADHGLHVLCEKPVFMPTDAGYERFVSRLLDAGRVVYPCHNYKFAPILELMQGIVSSPAFGEVLAARFRTVRKGHAVGVPDWNPDWRRDPVYSGGGILRDHGPHSVYLATSLTGLEPEAVSCLIGNMRRDAYDQTEDTALLTIRCEGGAQIVLDLTWSGSFRNSYYSINGSGGTIVVENDDVFYTRAGEVIRTELPSEFDDPSHREWFTRMLADFVDMVANPDRQYALLQESIVTSTVIDAAYESAGKDGEWVYLKLPTVGKQPSAD